MSGDNQGVKTPSRRPTIGGTQITDIGVLPDVVARINELADAPSTTGDDVGRLILQDPTLTSKILRIINSSYYGLRLAIDSVPHAVSYLGVHQVRNLVVSSALVQSFRFDHGFVEPQNVWKHSLGCAIGAKRMGDMLPGLNGDSMYLGGLLHDLGRIIMLSQFAERYSNVINSCERGLCTLQDAETSCFDISHEEAGFVLGQAWGFSEDVLAMIRHHHNPRQAGAHTASAAVVGFVNAICHIQGLKFGFEIDDEFKQEERQRSWEALVDAVPGYGQLNPEPMEEMVQRSIASTEELVANMF